MFVKCPSSEPFTFESSLANQNYGHFFQLKAVNIKMCFSYFNDKLPHSFFVGPFLMVCGSNNLPNKNNPL